MVKFPLSTELLVFDLEAYVPEADRKRKTGASLAVNPFRQGAMQLTNITDLFCYRQNILHIFPDHTFY